MSRFAAYPKWLSYLPPTMSPCETSQAPGLLEHPAEAFAYFRHTGVPKVVCEEKHMGSRAVVIVCRDEDVVRDRKSTRLNSSHGYISYAVFCLKKKNTAVPMHTGTDLTSTQLSDSDL